MGLQAHESNQKRNRGFSPGYLCNTRSVLILPPGKLAQKRILSLLPNMEDKKHDKPEDQQVCSEPAKSVPSSVRFRPPYPHHESRKQTVRDHNNELQPMRPVRIRCDHDA